MNLRRIERDALFITSDPWAGWCLPKGTVIALLSSTDSPILGRDRELHVSAPDVIGRVWRGWIAGDTPLSKKAIAPGTSLYLRRWDPKRKMQLTAWDELRELALLAQPRDGHDNRGRPVRPWTIVPYLSFHGRTLEIQRLVQQAIVELGGRVKRADDADTNVSRLLRLIFNEEITVNKIQKIRSKISKEIRHKESVRVAEQPNRRSKRAAPAKSAASMAASLGAKLLEIVKTGTLRAIAAQLAGGKDVTRKQLVQLRDGLNDAAAKLREKKQGSVASQLSNLNRLVRRLERARR